MGLTNAWLKVNESFCNGLVGSSWMAWAVDQWVGHVLWVTTWVGLFPPGPFFVGRQQWVHPFDDHGVTQSEKACKCSEFFFTAGFCGFPGAGLQ